MLTSDYRLAATDHGAELRCIRCQASTGHPLGAVPGSLPDGGLYSGVDLTDLLKAANRHEWAVHRARGRGAVTPRR